MTERDELRTADLADQRPAEPARRDLDPVEETDPVEEIDLERRDDLTGRDDVIDRGDDVIDRRDDAVAPAERMAPDRAGAASTSAGPLLVSDDAEGFRARWNDIQNTPKDIEILVDYLLKQYRKRVWSRFSHLSRAAHG